MVERDFRVVVVGAGISGLFIAEKLKRAGIDFTVYEKADEVGGTWRENTYPGLFVDVPSRQYEFPFQPNYDWSRKFAPASEIQAYIKKVADDRNLRQFIRFNEEIAEAKFADGRWHIKTANGRSDVADIFIGASGFLHKHTYPDIEGRDSFAGISFHSARWDHSVEFAGKRWGVIGSGCSGIQITEALSYEDCDVTQFIRRAQWINIRDNPHTKWWERVLLRLPFAYTLRQNYLWKAHGKADRWRLEPGEQRKKVEQVFLKELETIEDPDLRRKLTPTYPLGGTRIPKSDRNYYKAVQQPNVHVEDRPIARIVPDGIELKDGTLVPIDVLVYATGYDSHAYMRPINVTGLNGVTIDELWKDTIYSYRGVALPGFPNMYLLYGPFAPVNNIPVPLGLDQEIAYIMRLIEKARREHVAISPSAAATQRFVDRMHEGLKGTVWLGCDNWYSDKGGTPILWPLPHDEHRTMFQDDALEDLEIIRLEASQDGRAAAE